MKVIISGAGIGGLTTALCLVHFGHEVVVLERSSALHEVGTGIQISPNAMKVFKALNMDNDLLEPGFCPPALEVRMGVSGRDLCRIPLADYAVKRWGSPYLTIHRADYISMLEKTLHARSPDSLQYGKKVVGYRQSDDRVIVNVLDDSVREGDVLIAADGIHSPIRSQMLGTDKPVFTGNVAWRTVVPVDKLGEDALRPVTCVWMGKRRHCATYPVRGGTWANLVAVVERDDWQTESWTEQGSVDEALADFDGWHPTITRMISESDRLFRWALFDRAPLPSWIDGRVALLGDAAHPMLPFLAQGANMAVEDAWVIAQKLSTMTHVEAALDSYQRKRFGRTGKVQARSRRNARIFHQSTIPGQVLTYGAMWGLAKVVPEFIYQLQDDLYGYDVTA